MTTQNFQSPTVVERAEQPYVAIQRTVTMSTIAEVADRLGDVFGWLGERGIPPVEAPFFKYDVIDTERELVIQVGVPIAEEAKADGEVLAGTLSAGRYASVSHVGHPDELVDVTAHLLSWTEEQGHRFDVSQAADGEHWTGRLEIYRTDPDEEPDMSKWETELAFKLAD